MKKLAKLTDVPIDEFLNLAAEPALIVHFADSSASIRCPVYSGESFDDTLRRMRRLLRTQAPTNTKPSEAFLLGFHNRTLYKLPVDLAKVSLEPIPAMEAAST